MSSVNYKLNYKGVRLLSSDEVWTTGRNGKRRLNPAYSFVGKMDVSMSGMIVSASDNKKPTYRGDVCALNRIAKSQIIDHFYNEDGKRNRRTVAYFAVKKSDGQKTESENKQNK